jgi:hypothetical protein
MTRRCGCLKVRTKSLTKSIHVRTNVWADTEAGESRDDPDEATAEQSTSSLSDSDEAPGSATSTDKNEEHDSGVAGILNAEN